VEHRGAYLYVFFEWPAPDRAADRSLRLKWDHLSALGLTEADIKLMNKDWKLIRAGKKK
jgi:hypothetical protein